MARISFYFSFFVLLLLASCFGSTENNTQSSNADSKVIKPKGEITIYSFRNSDWEKDIAARYLKETGIKVNWVHNSSDKLLIQLQNEGVKTPADIIWFDDAVKLSRAVKRDLLQPVVSEELHSRVPVKFRDENDLWFGLSKYTKVAVGHADGGALKNVSSFSDLAGSGVKNNLNVRSGKSSSIQGLVASIMLNSNADNARKWCSQVVKNMAQPPKGNDKTQLILLTDKPNGVALVNSRDWVEFQNSNVASYQELCTKLSAKIPVLENGKNHFNISGAGVSKYSKNVELAKEFLLFVTQVTEQEKLAEAFCDFPIHAKASIPESLSKLGAINEDLINVSAFGEINSQVSSLIKDSGWK